MASNGTYILIRVLLFLSFFLSVHAQLQIRYYSETCPPAEDIIRNAVLKAFFRDNDTPAGVLRLHFHDCFVRGCDASILLDGTDTEKNAPPNLSLHGYEVIDDAKAELENFCPGVVSCADILAYAARDSVVLMGGRVWQVPAGRKDGVVSLISEPTQFLPPPAADVTRLTNMFAAKQLTQDDMVTLSGSHSIGVSHCSSFINRLYNFNQTFEVDPSLNAALAKKLQQLCPSGNPNPNTVVPIDSATPRRFDNAYFTNLKFDRGLLTSDQVLFTDSATQNAVIENSRNRLEFNAKFAQAMIKMSSIDVKTGTEGEIRKNCRAINDS